MIGWMAMAGTGSCRKEGLNNEFVEHFKTATSHDRKSKLALKVVHSVSIGFGRVWEGFASQMQMPSYAAHQRLFLQTCLWAWRGRQQV